MNLSKKTRGHGKTEFKENVSFVLKELQKKTSVSKIYTQLNTDGKVSIDVSLFRRYVRELKARIAAENASSSTLIKSAPPLHSSSTTSASDSKSAFNPKPMDNDDLDDEFGGVETPDDAVSHSVESEVRHG